MQQPGGTGVAQRQEELVRMPPPGQVSKQWQVYWAHTGHMDMPGIPAEGSGPRGEHCSECPQGRRGGAGRVHTGSEELSARGPADEWAGLAEDPLAKTAGGSSQLTLGLGVLPAWSPPVPSEPHRWHRFPGAPAWRSSHHGYTAVLRTLGKRPAGCRTAAPMPKVQCGVRRELSQADPGPALHVRWGVPQVHGVRTQQGQS